MNINSGHHLGGVSASTPKIATVRRLRIWAVAAIALVLVLGGYWYFGNSQSNRGPRGGDAAPVRTAQVVRRDMAVVEHTVGTVVANTTVNVTSRVQGIVDSAAFKEGQFVKKGDLLFQIDPRGFQASLEQARAVLAKDTASLTNAIRDRDRYASLAQQGAISDQQRTSSATTADVLTATVAADKAAVDLAALNLDYSRIRSPVDGKTGPLLVQPGNMVSANGQTALVTIQEVKPVKLSFTLPQTDLGRIQARQRGKGLVAMLDKAMDSKGQALSAPVNFVSNAVSATSGTIELRADFANDDLSLVPGQLVDVTVQMDDIPNALVVPRDAVNDGPDGTYVYVVEDGKAVEHPVKILFDDIKFVAVSGNLQPGDTVITEGQLRVEPNAQVRVITDNGGGANPVGPGGARRGGNRGARGAGNAGGNPG
jgi:multidrug efflux system membrane fusion protein